MHSDEIKQLKEKEHSQKRLIYFLVGGVAFLCVSMASLVGAVTYSWYNANQPPEQVWSHAATGEISTAPLVTERTVFGGSLGGEESYFYAIDRKTGEERWRYPAHTNIHYWADQLTSNQLAIFTAGRFIYAIDEMSGEMVWENELMTLTGCQCPAFRHPTIVDDVLFIPSGDGRLYALDALTGFEIWHYQTPRSISARPIIHQQSVFVGGRNGIVYELDIVTGRSERHYPFDHTIYEIAVDDTQIYVNFSPSELEPGQMAAIDRASSNTVWKFGASLSDYTGLTSNILQTDDLVYTMSTDGLYALSKIDGRLVWQFTDIKGGVHSDFALANGRIHFGDSESYGYILDAQTGTLINRYWVGNLNPASRMNHFNEFLFTPTAVDGVLYFGWFDALYAIKEEL